MSTLMYDWVFSMTSGATLRHILSNGIFYLKSVPKSA
ncbi:hypothetical protein C358_06731 [Cryptococcus neoformans MW-RSA852]|nr:hypothetical protein C358_06731 [Cryptococcus neoformans var. grubii MW-RSA852]